MNSINLKFKNARTYFATGIIWVVIGILNTIQLLFFAKFHPLPLLYSISIVLDIILAVHYLTFSKKAYIKISSNYICIYKWVLSKPYEIRFDEINYAEVAGNKFYVMPLSNFSKKDLLIHIDYLYKQDYEILIETFNKHGILVRDLYKGSIF